MSISTRIIPKSTLVKNGAPVLIDPDRLNKGDIAINYAAGCETVMMKNSEGEIVTFSSEGSKNRIKYTSLYDEGTYVSIYISETSNNFPNYKILLESPDGYIDRSDLISGSITSIKFNPSTSKASTQNFTSLSLEEFKNENIKSLDNLCYNIRNLREFKFGNFEVKNISSCKSIFQDSLRLKYCDFFYKKWNSLETSTFAFYNTDFEDYVSISSINFPVLKECDNMFYQTNIKNAYVNSSTITNARSMFYGCKELTKISLTLPNVIDRKGLVQNCSSLESLDFTLSTEANESLNGTLSGCTSLKSISSSQVGDTSNVKDFSNCFSNCSSLVDGSFTSLINVDTATNMSSMFSGCTSLNTINVSNWDTSNVTNMSYMFRNCISLPSLDLSSWTTSNVTNMSYMFYQLPNSTPNHTSALKTINMSGWDTSNVTNMSYMFSGLKSMTSIDLSPLNTSNVTNMSYMFFNSNMLESIDVSNFNTSKLTNMGSMFRTNGEDGNWTDETRNAHLKEIIGLENFDTSKVTNMAYLFSGQTELENVDFSHFNTSNVTNFSSMFSWCNKLVDIDVSNFDTSKATNLNSMFVHGNLKKRYRNVKGLEKFNTSKVTDFGWMFRETSIMDLSGIINWDVSKGKNFEAMFATINCEVDLSKWKCSPEGSMYAFMHNNACTKLDMSGFDTKNVTRMCEMFNCQNLTELYLDSLDLTKVITYDDKDNGQNVTKFDNPKRMKMFIKAPKLKTIRVQNCSDTTKDMLIQILAADGVGTFVKSGNNLIKQ